MAAPRGILLKYPDRKRCLACHRYFGFEVIGGLYCCRECAGLPPLVRVEAVPLPPGVDPRSLPRSCRLPLWQGGRAKQRFANWEMAEAVRVQQHHDQELESYECPACGYFHLGHDRAGQPS